MAVGLPLGFTGSRIGFGIKTYLVIRDSSYILYT